MKEITERFVAAVVDDSGVFACEQLTPATAASVAGDGICAGAVTDLDISPGRVTRVQVYSVSAKVDLGCCVSYFLELTRDGWRISAAGCAPQGRDSPFTCEAEA